MKNQQTNFTWIPFFRELAEKLLLYKNKQEDLCELLLIKTNESFVKKVIIKTDTGNSLIDPFTVFALINRGTKDENRRELCYQYKLLFHISSEIPQNFSGIPVVNSMRTGFAWSISSKKEEDNRTLWNLFEAVLNNASSDIEKYFNQAIKQLGIKYNLSMGLFWIMPDKFLSLDSLTRKYLKQFGISFYEMPNYTYYRKTLDNIKEKMAKGIIKEKSFAELSYMNWLKETKSNTSNENQNVVDNSSLSKYDKYIQLLKGCYNIVLTGAPGTGKTYLARKIAEAMGAEYEMVQFHPSYDYSDFVEGLRPVKDENGNIAFERKDGIFKSFCKKALENENFTGNFEDIYQKYIDNLIECEEAELTTTVQKKPFKIAANSNRNITVFTAKTQFVVKKEFLKAYIEKGEILDWKPYTTAIGEDIKSKHPDLKVAKSEVKNKNYVFIIDEINRGEISKIFGELFFSIDPGYRKEEDRIKVKTQYQELVEQGDVFRDGFFVPENVYIISTMNDIDRSVESMDFAMRRRFTWIEVAAEESADNMSIQGEARERMFALNDAILKTEGLGREFQIGGALFLNQTDMEVLWDYHLSSLLKEYLRGMPDAEANFKKLEEAFRGVDSFEE